MYNKYCITNIYFSVQNISTLKYEYLLLFIMS